MANAKRMIEEKKSQLGITKVFKTLNLAKIQTKT